MFELSYTEAMRIQRAQMAWYRRRIGLAGVRAIKKATLPCPPGIHPDELIPISVINKLVPRGGAFECIPWRMKYQFYRSDPTQEAMHDAIRRGLL